MKVYLDCGTGHGEGLLKHIEKYGINSEWKVFSFEANPSTVENFKNNKALQDKLKQKNIQVTLIQKAVWIENGTIELNREGVNRENIQNEDVKKFIDSVNDEFQSGKSPRSVDLDVPDWGGSTILDVNNFDKSGLFQEKLCAFHDKVFIECIDFCEWFKENISPEDEVLMKIDIEGAEYQVLQKMIEKDILCLLKEINIEFHSWIMKNNDVLIEIENKIEKYCNEHGVILHDWE